jgi:hypothetical protein
LKSLKGNDKFQGLKFQLSNKSKTILELLEYIERHEDMASPKIIETINSFKTSRKEDDKLSIYNKFVECAHIFIQQSSRSEEQKIFKDNIRAYLDIIENSDPLLNGTPKLKKHSGNHFVISSNNKKDQIEKDFKNVANISTTPPRKVLSPEETRKEILAKYGLKDRARQPSIESSCSSADEEFTEEIKHLSDKELCLKYGLPELYIPEEKKIDSQSSSNSLLNLLSKIRNTSALKVAPQEKPLSSASSAIVSQIDKDLPEHGLASKMKIMFEQLPSQDSPHIVRSSFARNEDIKKLSEGEIVSPIIPRKFSMLQRSSTISHIGFFQNENMNEKLTLHPGEMAGDDSEKKIITVPVQRSSSFSKFKNAFENGIGLNEDSDNDSDSENFVRDSTIASELQALRTDSKIQNMFRLCRSGSDPTRSPKPNRVLDKNTLQQVAKSKSAITSMFESQGPKITFGGNRPTAEPQNISKKVEKSKSTSTPLDNRKWVFDTIQKYFDVIVEEEQEVEKEAAQTERDYIVSDEDKDNESDYTSAEEEVTSVPSSPFSPKVTVCKKFNLQSYFQKDQERRCSSVIGQPVRKVSIDDFVADAAKQFDKLAVDSDLSLNDIDLKKEPLTVQNKSSMASSCQNLNQLSKSGISQRRSNLILYENTVFIYFIL